MDTRATKEYILVESGTSKMKKFSFPNTETTDIFIPPEVAEKMGAKKQYYHWVVIIDTLKSRFIRKDFLNGGLVSVKRYRRKI